MDLSLLFCLTAKCWTGIQSSKFFANLFIRLRTLQPVFVIGFALREGRQVLQPSSLPKIATRLSAKGVMHLAFFLSSYSVKVAYLVSDSNNPDLVPFSTSLNLSIIPSYCWQACVTPGISCPLPGVSSAIPFHSIPVTVASISIQEFFFKRNLEVCTGPSLGMLYMQVRKCLVYSRRPQRMFKASTKKPKTQRFLPILLQFSRVWQKVHGLRYTECIAVVISATSGRSTRMMMWTLVKTPLFTRCQKLKEASRSWYQRQTHCKNKQWLFSVQKRSSEPIMFIHTAITEISLSNWLQKLTAMQNQKRNWEIWWS